jgi:translation elongation factor EF-G
VLADRLRRRFNVHVDLTEPRVPYRETIHTATRNRPAEQGSLRRYGCESRPRKETAACISRSR